MSAGKPITEDGLRLRKKKKMYYSFPSVNHTPPPGNVEKKGKSEKRGGREMRERGMGRDTQRKGRVVTQLVSCVIIEEEKKEKSRV